jgi:hypothetical protein
MYINALVEGIMDEAAAQRIITAAGHQLGICYGKRGCSYIRQKVPGFNEAARDLAILALVDHMDTRLSCAPEVVSLWLLRRRPFMLLRVVVRELESWLLADREGLARFLGIPTGRVPPRPEEVEDPKRTLVNLARQSRSRTMRTSMVPARGSTSREGVLYASEMIRFIHGVWNIEAARINAPSMDRCFQRLEELPGDV